MGAGRALGSAGALARNGRSADGGRMSTPPPIAPVSTPTPEPRRPWWRRRVVPIAVAGVVRRGCDRVLPAADQRGRRARERGLERRLPGQRQRQQAVLADQG